MENMEMKRKRDKKIDLPRLGFEPRIFEQSIELAEVKISRLYYNAGLSISSCFADHSKVGYPLGNSIITQAESREIEL